VRRLAVAAFLLLAACTVTPPPDTAVVEGNMNTMTPVLEPAAALNYAAWALADPARTRDNAINGSYAMAAVDFLAGYVATSARFTGINYFAVQQLLAGRQEERRILGVAPGATSTQVVNALLDANAALRRHDLNAARAALPADVFTLGPERTIEILANLPPQPLAAGALSAIARQYNGGAHRFCAFCM
jgi:hypothetical protein